MSIDDQTMPHNKEAEETLLGQLILDPDNISKVTEFIPEPEVFYNTHNRTIWKTLQSMRSNDNDINLATVIDNIPETQKKYISNYFVSGLIDNIASTANALSYAKLIYEKWLLRKVVTEASQIQRAAFGSNADAHKALEDLNSTVTKALHLRPTKKFNLDELLDRTVERIYDEKNLIKTGYGVIDKITGGMTRGEITVIAGRPSMGKSTVMINIVKNLIDHGKKVIVFNREMTNVEMMKKIFILEAGDISYRRLRMMQLTEHDNQSIEAVKEKISSKYRNLIMFDDIKDLRSGVRHVNRFAPDVVVDDYIQMVNVPGIEDKRLQVVEIMQHYKWMAKSLNCSAILLSQLNREVERGRDKRPRLSHLSESGSIETDAESVIFVYYPWKYLYRDHHPNGEYGKYDIRLLVDKNRYGEAGYAEMGFYGDGCLLTETQDIAIERAKKAGELNE
jgi:replicative DNA helicase